LNCPQRTIVRRLWKDSIESRLDDPHYPRGGHSSIVVRIEDHMMLLP